MDLESARSEHGTGHLSVSAPVAASAILAFVAASIGVLSSALDQTVVVTSLPSIITDMRIPFTRLNEAAWIVTGYLLGYTVAMPLVGRLSDIHGWWRAYLLCTIVFSVGSLGCALANELPWLVAARIVQAAGGGGIVPVTMALATRLFSVRSRSLALGIVGGVAEAGGVLGPLYGALIVEHWGWRWIFYLNIPLAVAVVATMYFTTTTVSDDRQQASVDYLGAGLIAASLALLTIGLSQEAGAERPLVLTAVILGGALFLFALFLVVESRATHPLLNLAAFRRLPFSAANLVSFLTGAALITAMVDVPLFGATVLGMGPIESGLTLLRMTVMIPVGAILGGLLGRFVGLRTTAALGLAICAGGLYLVSRWPASVDEVTMTRDLVTAGLGFGLVIAPVNTTAIGAAGRGHAGEASALVTVLRMVGMMVGLSALTTWGLGRFNDLVGSIPMPLPQEDESVEALNQRIVEYQAQIQDATLMVFHEIFFGAALLCVAGLVAVWFFRAYEHASS